MKAGPIIECIVHPGNRPGVAVSVRLEVPDGVHPPGPLTTAHLSALDVRGGDRVLDLGCGCGIFGIYADRAGASRVVLTDIDAASLDATRRNVMLNHCQHIDLRLGDLFEPVDHERFDLIIGNVPQTPAPAHFRTDKWGGPEGVSILLRLAREAPRHLHPGGRLYFVHIGLAYPHAVIEAFSRHFELCAVHESRRVFTPEEYESYQPGLWTYLRDLRLQGKAEFKEEAGIWSFLTRFYRAKLLEREAES
ncbi:MAG: methyltransferase [Planctomycetes bacterium]|nr:methyltransferase [Planctomycetota bacterium]